MKETGKCTDDDLLEMIKNGDRPPSPVERGVIKPKQFHVERIPPWKEHGVKWLVVHKQGWSICEAYSRRDAYRISNTLNKAAL